MNRTTSARKDRRPHRRGLSLLEVLLALAILGGALAAIGELMRSGSRAAEQSRDLTTAQLLSETVMSEITAGLLPVQATNATPVDDPQHAQDWSYSIQIEQIDQEGLIAVWVTVRQNRETARPMQYTLVRWMIDPNVTTTGEL